MQAISIIHIMSSINWRRNSPVGSGMSILKKDEDWN